MEKIEINKFKAFNARIALILGPEKKIYCYMEKMDREKVPYLRQ